MVRSFIAGIALACALGPLGFSGTARAADPDAPPGAPATWLPNQAWVLDHWLPYDETRLDAVLHTTRDAVTTWLGQHDDKVPLTVFARQRGIPVAGLAQRLVGPRPHGTSLSLYKLLVSHAEKTLTQPHLMHHMLGHLNHTGAGPFIPDLFGLTARQLDELHWGYGLSYAAIAARQGLNPTVAAREIVNEDRVLIMHGVMLHQTPISWARRWFGDQQHDFTLRGGWFYSTPPVIASYRDGRPPPAPNTAPRSPARPTFVVPPSGAAAGCCCPC